MNDYQMIRFLKDIMNVNDDVITMAIRLSDTVENACLEVLSYYTDCPNFENYITENGDWVFEEAGYKNYNEWIESL